MIEYYNDKVNTDKVKMSKQGLDKLDEAFDENVKIPKTSVSFVIYTYYRCIKDKKSTSKLTDIVKQFLDNYDSNEEYKSFIQNGTSSVEPVIVTGSIFMKFFKRKG